MSSNNTLPLNAVVAGLGFMGAVHAQNVLDSPLWNLAGIVEPRGEQAFEALASTGNLGRLDLAVETLKTVPMFSTLAEASEAVPVDAAIVAVPLAWHVPLAEQALQSGLHCLLEKPFAPTLQECEQVLTVAEKTGKQLMIAHCVRFDPVWMFLAETIARGTLGQLRSLECRRIAGIPTWGSWSNSKVKHDCGGALLDLTIHDLDFIDSWGKISDWKLLSRQDEYREIALTLANVPTQVKLCSGWLPEGTPFQCEYLAVFEKGSLFYHSLRPGEVAVGCGPDSYVKELPGSGYVNELNYFGECIRSARTPSRCPAQDSARIIDLCRRIQAAG